MSYLSDCCTLFLHLVAALCSNRVLSLFVYLLALGVAFAVCWQFIGSAKKL